jgi:hypothetical protein
MEIRDIVNQVADQADEFLADVTKRDEARAGIAEWITIHHPKLAPAARKQAIAETMRVLEREGFFDAVAGSGSDDEGATGPLL